MASPESYNDLLHNFGLPSGDGYDVSYHVGYIKNAEGEIEYTKPLPSVRQKPNSQYQLSDFISQADPVLIKPNKIESMDRDYKLLFAFSDAQIDYRNIDGVLQPIHDERALAVARLICAEYQPEYIINLGDTLDFANISRFASDSDHFNHSLNPAINRVHQMYAELRSDNPHAEIHEVDSNHNTRLAKFVLKQMPEFYGVRQAGSAEKYPVMTYPFLTNLEALEVDWHSGYGSAEYVYGDEYNAPPIVFKHGNMVVSNGSTASKESAQNPENHIVRGHGHRMESHWRTNRAGKYLASIAVGCTCSIDGDVPSYKSAVDDLGNVVKYKENWQQGVLMITDYMNGNYQFDQIPINNGVAYYEGKEFNGAVLE